jgi:hypothetical protein
MGNGMPKIQSSSPRPMPIFSSYRCPLLLTSTREQHEQNDDGNGNA